MFFDPLYWVMLLPTILLALWAQAAVKGRFEKYSRVASSSGLTGAQAAARMMQAEGITDVVIERSEGFLSDHYDPRAKKVRLSPAVHDGTSLAALGVACHEVGHVYQHAQGYAPLKVRNILVPLSFGANIGFILILVGFFLSSMKLAIVGLALFSVIAIFQIVNLPVEFNASARAKAYLANSGMVRPGPESAAVSSVLSAAAMTYVAATAQSVMQVLYWAYLIFGRRE